MNDKYFVDGKLSDEYFDFIASYNPEKDDMTINQYINLIKRGWDHRLCRITMNGIYLITFNTGGNEQNERLMHLVKNNKNLINNMELVEWHATDGTYIFEIYYHDLSHRLYIEVMAIINNTNIIDIDTKKDIRLSLEDVLYALKKCGETSLEIVHIKNEYGEYPIFKILHWTDDCTRKSVEWRYKGIQTDNTMLTILEFLNKYKIIDKKGK